MTWTRNANDTVTTLTVSAGPATAKREDMAPRSAGPSLVAYLSMARPDHWFKNVFMALGVLLAYFCHPEVFGAETILAILWAVLATCLIASSNYVLNEILDAP